MSVGVVASLEQDLMASHLLAALCPDQRHKVLCADVWGLQRRVRFPSGLTGLRRELSGLRLAAILTQSLRGSRCCCLSPLMRMFQWRCRGEFLSNFINEISSKTFHRTFSTSGEQSH